MGMTVFEVAAKNGCSKCIDDAIRNGWAIAEACASVGIENGKSPLENAVAYFDGLHQQHKRKRKRRKSEGA